MQINLFSPQTKRFPHWMALLGLMAGLLLSIAPAAAQGNGPSLTIPDNLPAQPNGSVTIPVDLATDGNSINSIAFSVDIDESLLSFDATDGNADGIPDAVTPNLPAGYIASVSYDVNDTDGEIDIAIFTLSSPPLSDGQVASITLQTGSTEGQAAVAFSADPVASFGTPAGQSIPGTTDDGSVLIGNGNSAPVAAFSCSPTSGQAPLEVTCTDASTGSITSWSWDFGDDTTSTDQNPAAHTYNVDGSYTVSLTVTGADGSTANHSETISVSDLQCPPGEDVCLPLLSAGDLAVDWASVIFPQTSLAGQDVLAYAIDETWTISDTTNLGAGWHVTIIADDHLRGSADPTNRVINVGTSEEFKVSCLDSEINAVSGDNTNLPGCPTGAQAVPIAGESPLTMLSADAGDGMGTFNFVPHFQLLVPGTTIIDVYSTNIFVDAIAGP